MGTYTNTAGNDEDGNPYSDAEIVWEKYFTGVYGV